MSIPSGKFSALAAFACDGAPNAYPGADSAPRRILTLLLLSLESSL